MLARLVRITVLSIGLLGFAIPAVSGETLDSKPWLDIRSNNFRIYSVLGVDRTVELLRHLEIMRASLGDASEESTWRASVPTIIVAVDDHDDYVSIGAPEYSGGYFFSDLRENAILIQDSDDSAGIQIILHEYAHYLNRQSHPVRFPRWFEEGNAEYLSHSRLVDQAFEYGLAPDSYLATLGFGHWMPLASILAVTDAASLSDIDGAMFYAQSWLLVHYLRSRPGADEQLADQVTRYVRSTAQGQSQVAAFEEAFGLDAGRLDTDLLKYYLERQFSHRSVPTDTALPGFTTRIREMSADEVQLALARMALRFDNVAGAERWFNDVLSSDDLRALAEAGLGRVAGYRGNIEAANTRFESAIRLMAWDFTIWMDYAQYWAQRVAGSYSPAERVRYASRLIDSLENALTISEATPELNSLMGFAYLARGKNPHDAIEYLEAASEGAPHDQASRLLLANAYLYVGRFEDAVRVANSVLLFEHEPGLISAAARDVIDAAREQQSD
ncbi:MAG: tetratricopeptide repeat protein [Woeseiaceae bacterium]